MTQSEFNELPLRLRPKHLRAVLDLSSDQVGQWIGAHPECVIEVMPGGKKILSKRKVALALQLDYE